MSNVNMPEYNGAGVYALVDDNGDMYIGSSKHCRQRIAEHLSGGSSNRIREAIKGGTKFTPVILEEMPEASEADLVEAEAKHLKEADKRAAYNEKKVVHRPTHFTSQEPHQAPARSVAAFARSRGVTTQAVYKRLSKLRIDVQTLRVSGHGRLSGELTEEGMRILEAAMDGKPIPGQQPSTFNINHQPQSINQQPSTVNQQEVDSIKEKVNSLQSEVESLRHDLTDARHRAELAEMRATAAEGERDFLRAQLDNAIKANALASMKRLAPPEDSHKGLVRRVADAWANMWARRDKTSEAPTEDE